MSTVTVTLVQQDGEEVCIADASVGISLMEVAKGRGVVGILGDCGGGCACATCHVYIDPSWREAVGEADAIEEMTLDMVSDITRENSRLGCQITLTAELDGLRVAVAPNG
jgi:ferredoxin, 2Fe-2S